MPTPHTGFEAIVRTFLTWGSGITMIEFSAFAFSVGMVALINPCGFGLLPAYLGFFLGQDDESSNTWTSLNRAQGIGLAMTLGMLVVFGFFGLILGGLQSALAEVLPYFNIALGIGLVVLGIAMLRGYQLMIRLPKMQQGGQSGSFASMFLFGMSYATASLTCTLALFITAVNSSSFSSDGGSSFGASLGALVSYGLGMGLLATMITVLLAFGKRGLVNRFKTILPKINIISAILILIVGPFSIVYGIWELQVLDKWPLGDGIWGWADSIILNVTDLQTSATTWFSTEVTVFGRTMERTGLLGWPFVFINVVIVIGGFVSRRRLRGDDETAELATDADDTATDAVGTVEPA